MLRNNIDEDYLKGFVPGLEHLLWTDETDYSKQIERATQMVFTDLDLKDLTAIELMPELELRPSATAITATETATGIEDTMRNRKRLVVENISQTISAKVLTLEGSNDNTTYYLIGTLALTPLADTPDKSLLFFKSYRYYRLITTVTSGEIDYRAFLQESKYDLLFTFKALEFICRDAKTTEGDQFNLKEIDFRKDYYDLLHSGKYELDTTGDGIPDLQTSANTLDIIR